MREPVIEGGELDLNTGLWRYAPKKIAFVHYGKCAGVYTQKYLRDFVIPNVPQFNSWWDFTQGTPERSLHRDWTKEELLEIATKDIDSGFAHNHMINWCSETVKSFNDNKWFTFTFLRDPKDIICSLYFWSRSQKKKHSSEDLANPLRKEIESMSGQSDPQKVSLDAFFNFFISDEDARNLWTLPDYIDDISYVAEFNESNFKNFLLNYFHHQYAPTQRKNASESNGYKFYYENGEISESTNKLIEEDSEYRRYDKYLKQGRAEVDELEVERLKKYFKPNLDILKSYPGGKSTGIYFWLASGAIRDFFLGVAPKDLDLFFPDVASRDVAKDLLLELGATKVKDTPRGEQFKYKEVRYDLMCWDGNGDPACFAKKPEDTVKWFDYTVEMASLDSNGKFHYDSRFYNDALNKKLVRNSIQDLYPRQNNLRLLRYVKKGYTIDQENLIKFLEDQEATFLYRRKNKTKCK